MANVVSGVGQIEGMLICRAESVESVMDHVEEMYAVLPFSNLRQRLARSRRSGETAHCIAK